MNLQDLRTELDTDPLTLGYAGMTNAQAADSLTAKTRTRNRTTMSGSQIFEAIDLAEFTALTTELKEKVKLIVGLGDSIQIGPSSKARAFLLEAFGPGSASRTALAALALEPISRAEEVLGGQLPGIYGFRTAEEAVANARAL